MTTKINVFLLFLLPAVLAAGGTADLKSASMNELVYHAQRYGNTAERRAMKALARDELFARGWFELSTLMAARYADHVAGVDVAPQLLGDLSDGVSWVVRLVIRFAPFGVMGLVADAILTAGWDALLNYAALLGLLIGCMLIVALIVNPIIVAVMTRRNPYPLVFTCLRESGVTAFFTRSSAANIPVNMELAKRLGLNRDTYAISLPLGATINMAGAAVTINVLTLAAAHTLGISVDFGTTLLLCVVASIAACGVSGVAGGSLLLIPMAASLFGIPNDISMQVVGVGFVIGVLQDAFEPALNSSTDVLFTAAADPVMRA